MPSNASSARVIILSLAAFAVSAQDHTKNPFSSQDALEEGRKLYYLNCGVCHGLDGASGRGAKLATKNRKYGNSDQEMFQVISNGIPGTAMPGLWLDEDSVWKILLFVRTLEPSGEKPCVAEPGDPRQGRILFTQKGKCATCHAVGMGGGRLGPDLSHIGSTHTRQQLREAILDPHSEIPDEYRAVRVATRGGSQLEGRLLNEDGYSLHMLDRDENLHSFTKAELAGVEQPPESLMPSYKESLTDTELDDLLAYLCTLE